MHMILSCSLITLSLAANRVLATLPKVDFDRMGTVGLAGTFAGLDIFRNSSSSIAFDPSTSSLLVRSPDGALTYLASTNPGGRIAGGCVLGDVFYLAGSFSSIGGASANNVASYTPASGVFAALSSNAPNGLVDTVLCDSKDNKVWAGGSFTSPGSSVAVWDPKSLSWSSPPFVGVSGAQSRVFSITTNSSDSSIFLAGSFITTFQGAGGSALNESNNPNIPYSAGATPFSSSLVPVPLENAQVIGSASSSDPNFGNIENILCPSGEDGPGNTWFAADQNTALITVRTFAFISSNGVRLGNTFLDGHRTTGFSVITIPDNQIQTLHYRDPATGQTHSCTDPCPLSTDSSLLYQDFLFDSTLSITGVQIKLSEFTGTPGLHLLQLLSSGAFASAVDSNNDVSCFARSASNTTRNGNWVAKVANTDIPGTTQTVLVSDVALGTSPSTGPSLTWYPYVSAVGNYDVNLLVPGCTNFQDCALRTAVKITVFPGENLQPWISTVSQQNTQDAAVLVYSGPISPSSSDFVVTISMTLADAPTGSGRGGKYELVADRVQLIFKSNNNTSGESQGGQANNGQGTKNGFGFLEWPRKAASSSVDATKMLPNSSETSLDAIAFSMYGGAGGSNGLSFANPSAITTIAHHPSGMIILGGNFTLSSGSASGSANIVAYKDGALQRLTDNGLNGPVTSLMLSGDLLFIGGGFTDTLSGSTTGQLRGIALYNVQQSAWSPLGAGLNGEVTSLGLKGGQLQVAGNFTELLTAENDALGYASGFAVWDIETGSWVNGGGFLVGAMTFIANGTSSTQLISGNVISSRKYGASGLVFLKNGDANGPIVTPLGAQLDGVRRSSSRSLSSNRRRSPIPKALTWVSHLKRSKIFSRQTQSTQLSTLPPPLPAFAPSVLTGAFWTNSSSSTRIAVIGGNFSFFSFPSPIVHAGVALYDPSSGITHGLQGSQINGTVRALLVDGNQLYIGGEFQIQDTNVDGLAIYDLSQQAWNTNAIQALQAPASAPVVVRSITKSTSKPNTIIIAGSFSQAGSLPCQAICAFDTMSQQWNALGNGIRGEVAAVAYAGNNQDFLIASGSIAISDNVISNVAQFSFINTTWTGLGTSTDLPGPVTAVEVNDKNLSSIFAAGRSLDGTSSFLSFWNGLSWSNFDSSFRGNSTIAQLTMVPLEDTHAVNGVIERDRMLLVSGLLDSSSFGTASCALFDGHNFIPYILSTAVTGVSGAASSLFNSLTSFNFSQRQFLATGVVILISIAISAGVVFLLALIGIIWTLLSRRDDKLGKLDSTEAEDNDSTHHRPSSLLEHINAATRTTILGTSPFDNATEGREEEKVPKDIHDPFAPDASNYIRAETPSDAIGGMMGEEMSRPAHARYSFDGTGEGELPISAGAEVEVLDDRDPAWWYARDLRTGQEGVVPAAYLY